jgi:hypothetical protein
MSKQPWLTPFRLSKVFKTLGATLPTIIYLGGQILDYNGGVNDGGPNMQDCSNCLGHNPRFIEPMDVTLECLALALFASFMIAIGCWLLVWAVRTPRERLSAPRWIHLVGVSGGIIGLAGAAIYVAEPLIFVTYHRDVRVDATFSVGIGALFAIIGMMGILVQEYIDERKRRKERQEHFSLPDRFMDLFT